MKGGGSQCCSNPAWPGFVDAPARYRSEQEDNSRSRQEASNHSSRGLQQLRVEHSGGVLIELLRERMTGGFTVVAWC